MARHLTISIISLLVLILVIPAVIIQFIPEGSGQVLSAIHDDDEETELPSYPTLYVSVYRVASETVERVPLEEYIRGVVASEMPVDFELEALKAQALAARTYIVRRLVEEIKEDDLPEGADVKDTEQHQVYQNEEELQQRWGRSYTRNMQKIEQAVQETMGQVLTYDGKPIDATFFSTSNGRTENSEEYWHQEIPYLRSVASPWDVESPRYEDQISIPLQEFQQALGIQLSSSVSDLSSISEIISRTTGDRVKQVQIGEKSFTGKEIRELLHLPSAHFEWKMENGSILIETKGWGHGVGMSQWGANGMAQEGYTSEQIVRHYYQNIEIDDYREWIVKR